MKNLLLSVIVLLASNSVYGRYIGFPGSNATWSVYDEKYYVEGDSTLNATVYKKYFLSHDSIVTSGSFYALLREDIAAKKVFAVAAGTTQEYLLYDFSVSVNNTVSVYPLSFPVVSGPVVVQVEMIDSVLIGGNFHKRMKIAGDGGWSSGYTEYWIEGMGSTMGIFNSGITGRIVTDITYPTLLCFEKDGVILFHNPDFTDCYEKYPVGISETEAAFRTKIYPNPANSLLFVESDTEIVSCELFSSYGEMLLNKSIGEKSFNLDISSYPSGLYMLALNSGKGLLVKQFIKTAL